ncbi:flagellar motor protein MotB [Anaeroselena agilis]|uniref:OmpA family protein n=1 Tax=Anaeroselena agilis TaxID=3063788 RepID=A0ABU3P241_9FIRM|nr:OmpA family protein [Selenomonadales bacterium 4137-cl]
MAKRRGGGGGGGGGHDAAGMMRWLLTYADLITLMMAFFVIMYAMSKADVAKFNALKNSLAVAFRTEGSASSLIYTQQGTQPVEQVVSLDGSKDTEDFQDIIRKVQANVKDQRKVMFVVDERGLTIRFLDNVLFDLGDAELRQDALGMLDAVGKALKNAARYVRIEGHADNLPINTVRFPSNWELSAARSIAVTRYLIDKHGVDPKRLASLGYGEYRPLYPNTSEENRAKNRRVDIVILRTERSGGEIRTFDPIKR